MAIDNRENNGKKPGETYARGALLTTPKGQLMRYTSLKDAARCVNAILKGMTGQDGFVESNNLKGYERGGLPACMNGYKLELFDNLNEMTREAHTRLGIPYDDSYEPKNAETLKPGNIETLKHGNTETLKHRNVETEVDSMLIPTQNQVDSDGIEYDKNGNQLAF